MRIGNIGNVVVDLETIVAVAPARQGSEVIQEGGSKLRAEAAPELVLAQVADGNGNDPWVKLGETFVRADKVCGLAAGGKTGPQLSLGSAQVRVPLTPTEAIIVLGRGHQDWARFAVAAGLELEPPARAPNPVPAPLPH